MKTIWKTAGIVGLGIAALALTPAARADRDDHHRDDRRENRHDDRRDNHRVSFFFNIFGDGIRASFGNVPRCEPPPPPPRCWVDGHYEVRQERIVHPGYWNEIVEPAQYGWARQGCRWVQVVVRPECHRRVWVPESCEVVSTRVWIPGGYEAPRYAAAY